MNNRRIFALIALSMFADGCAHHSSISRVDAETPPAATNTAVGARGQTAQNARVSADDAPRSNNSGNFVSPALLVETVSVEKRIREDFDFEVRYPRLVRAEGIDERSVRAFNRIAKSIAYEDTKWVMQAMKEDGRFVGFMNVNHDVTYATPDIISVTYTICSICCGAGSAGCNVRVFNYDPQLRRELESRDLFKPRSGYAQTLMAYCEPILRERYAGGHLDSKSKRERSEMYDRLSVTPTGLKVGFDEYEVGAGSNGTPEILVPYDVIRDKLDSRSPVARLGQ